MSSVAVVLCGERFLVTLEGPPWESGWWQGHYPVSLESASLGYTYRPAPDLRGVPASTVTCEACRSALTQEALEGAHG